MLHTELKTISNRDDRLEWCWHSDDFGHDFAQFDSSLINFYAYYTCNNHTDHRIETAVSIRRQTRSR